MAGLLYLENNALHGRLWALQFNPYGLLSLISFVASFTLMLYLVNKPARGDERIWLTLFLSSMCVFSGAEMVQRFSIFQEPALFWGMLSGVGLAVVPAALYLFALAYTNPTDRRYTGTTLTLLTTGYIFMFFYGFTSLLFNNDLAALKLYPWGYNNDAADGLVLIIMWTDVLLILSIARLINFRRRTRNAILRKQSLIFIIAASIPLIGGSITDGILPLVGVESLPPMAGMLVAAAGAVLAYGVLRYQLVTISPTLFSNTILSIMHESVIVVDASFHMLYMNPEAETILGTGTKAQHHKTLLDFVPRDKLDMLRAAFAKARTSQSAVNLGHIDMRQPNGNTLPVRITSSRVQSTDLEAYVLVLTDIAAELHTQSLIERQVELRTEELKEARAYLVASINSLEQGFILVNDELKIQLTNGMAQLLMNNNDNLIGAGLAQAAGSIPWDVKLPQVVQSVLVSKQSQKMQATAADGRFYVVFVTPVLAGNEVLGAAVIIEDITEQRILERSKDEFFSIASHELRTPLTAIRGNLSMAREYYPEAMKDESLSGLLKDAHDASTRLIEVVNDFLDSSRLEQGKMTFRLEPIGLKDSLATVQKDLKSLLAEHHSRIAVSGLEGLPEVQTDAARLQQILFNVLGNAVKYAGEGTIKVAAKHDGKFVRLSVIDQGKGISPENQKLLFHKFQQAGDSILTRDNTKGTGLGLYISKLLATGMGGDVVLDRSEEGKGSTFVISLPVSTKK